MEVCPMAAVETGGIGFEKVHSPFVRITHWLNAAAIIILIGSGWRIYNNVPIFSWVIFPEWATLGGDPEITYKLNKDVGFSNALLWDFAAMWKSASDASGLTCNDANCGAMVNRWGF